MKVVGTFVGGVGLALGLLTVGWFATQGGGEFIFDLAVGDCFDEPDEWETGGESIEVDVVDCATAHDAQVVGVGTLNARDASGVDAPKSDEADASAAYPADEELFAEIDRRCALIEGLPLDEFGILPVAPTEAVWRTLDGRYLCVALPYGGEPTSGSIVATP